MTPEKLQHIIPNIEANLNLKIFNSTPLSGGDINDVFLMETNNDKLVIKLNSASAFPGMFEAEKEGLEAIRNTHSISIPKVFLTGSCNDIAYLVLEYITPGREKENFWEDFGKKMAVLHQNTNKNFGFKNSNYIGSLPQPNKWCTSASEFYITQRLEPQFKMASANGYSFKNLSTFFKKSEEIIPEESASLIHGDLWSGNFIVNNHGQACLIDPSVSYFHREMDIAMMHLFGGFSEPLFYVYNEIFPLQEAWKSRLDIWQLYYLLVHLNLFGRSYYGSVNKILKKYI